MTVAELVLGALQLDPGAFEALVARDGGARLGILLLLAAGVSDALGQSVALFANRVRPRRFLLSLAVSAGVFAVSVLLWAGALDLSAGWIAGTHTPIPALIGVVGLGHAPRLFGLFALVPYFGSGFAAVLTVWTFLATAVGARAVFGLELADALIVLGVAWLGTEVAGRTIGRPLVAAARWLRRWSARSPEGSGA